jgi:hypothetical protein
MRLQPYVEEAKPNQWLIIAQAEPVLKTFGVAPRGCRQEEVQKAPEDAFMPLDEFRLHADRQFACVESRTRVPEEITADLEQIRPDLGRAHHARNIRRQLASKNLQARALEVIDRMSLEGFRSATTHLTEFER